MTLEKKISVSNWEGCFSLIFTLLLCTDGMNKKYFYCTAVKLAILHELIFVLWTSHYSMKLPLPSFFYFFHAHIWQKEKPILV